MPQVSFGDIRGRYPAPGQVIARDRGQLFGVINQLLQLLQPRGSFYGNSAPAHQFKAVVPRGVVGSGDHDTPVASVGPHGKINRRSIHHSQV